MKHYQIETAVDGNKKANWLYPHCAHVGGGEFSTSTSAQEMNAQVDGVETFTLV